MILVVMPREQPFVEGGTITRGEILEVLEDLVQNGGQTARISAIRQLREIRSMDEAGSGPRGNKFDALDDGEDEVTSRRRAKARG